MGGTSRAFAYEVGRNASEGNWGVVSVLVVIGIIVGVIMLASKNE